MTSIQDLLGWSAESGPKWHATRLGHMSVPLVSEDSLEPYLRDWPKRDAQLARATDQLPMSIHSQAATPFGLSS